MLQTKRRVRPQKEVIKLHFINLDYARRIKASAVLSEAVAVNKKIKNIYLICKSMENLPVKFML